jgi:phosphodiesterase/alkaline phosphatase D-like protein
MRRTTLLFALILSLSLWSFAQAQGTGQERAQAAQITQGPKVEHVDNNSAVIAWSTNVSASSVVRYGTDRNNLDQRATAPWGGITHRVTLKNLQPGTTYYYQVESGQASGTGTGAMSAINELRTKDTAAAGGQQQQQKFEDVRITSGPTVEPAGNNSAVVTWSTNVEASTRVRYGTDRNNLSKEETAPWGGTTHRVTLRELQPNTTYFFKVLSRHGRGTGTSSESNIAEFRTDAQGAAVATAAGQAPAQQQQTAAAQQQQTTTAATADRSIVAGPVVQNLTDTSARLWWLSAERARFVVRFGLDRNNLDQTATPAGGPLALIRGDKEHSVDLKNLKADTTYYFRILRGGDQQGNALAEGDLKTMAADFDDGNKLRITAGPFIETINDSSAVIMWSTNVRSGSRVRYGTSEGALTETAQAPWGQTEHRVEIKNLQPNTRYFFIVESTQAEGTGTMAKSEEAPFQTINRGEQALRSSRR